MHLTRAEISRVLPIPRKGTRYVARPLAYPSYSISVLAAVRDILHLARTAREVKEMIKDKKLKINGRVVRDEREPLTLLSLFEADRLYRIMLLPTGRFTLEPTKHANRIVKVVNKKILRGNNVQINFHDGTNMIAKDKITVGDSIELSPDLQVVKRLPLKAGAKVLISSGRNVGAQGVVEKMTERNIEVRVEDRIVMLTRAQVVAL